MDFFLFTDKCDIKNGGCEQVCIPDGPQGVCECGLGYVLEKDNHNCTTGKSLDWSLIIWIVKNQNTVYM